MQFAVPAAAEEIVFRGFLQTIFSRYAGMKIAIALQAALFGLCHVGYRSKAYIIQAGLKGIFYGWLFGKTGSLLLPIFLHFAWNSMVSWHGAKLLRTFLEYELQNLCRFRPTELFKASNQEGNATE